MERQKTAVVALDDALTREQYPQVIKMDIEGAEPLALKGMGRILDDKRLETIIIECSEYYLAKQGLTPDALLDTLRKKGFAFRVLDKDNYVGVRAHA